MLPLVLVGLVPGVVEVVEVISVVVVVGTEAPGRHCE